MHRMTGGGFGGCTVTLVHADVAGDLVDYLRLQYKKRFASKNIECTCYTVR